MARFELVVNVAQTAVAPPPPFRISISVPDMREQMRDRLADETIEEREVRLQRTSEREQEGLRSGEQLFKVLMEG